MLHVGVGAPHLESNAVTSMEEVKESSPGQRGQDEEEGDSGEEEEGSSDFLPGYPTFEDYSKVS